VSASTLPWDLVDGVNRIEKFKSRRQSLLQPTTGFEPWSAAILPSLLFLLSFANEITSVVLRAPIQTTEDNSALGVARGGPLDLSAQDKVTSALRAVLSPLFPAGRGEQTAGYQNPRTHPIGTRLGAKSLQRIRRGGYTTSSIIDVERHYPRGTNGTVLVPEDQP
jgi:hypothetical protein